MPDRPAPDKQAAAGSQLLALLDVIDTLRGPNGCSWDRDQTPRSLIPYLLEETYEVIESIERGNQQELREELGDLMLHVIFQVKLAEEQGHFTLADCLTTLTEKLTKRHPAVFGTAQADDQSSPNLGWETAKQQEKQRKSRLDGIPRNLPALNRARRIQERAALAGFDWSDAEPVWAKVHEELAELKDAQKAGDLDGMEDELGDVLFSLVNLGRFFDLSAEDALRRTITKFEYRFKKIEEELKRRGKGLEETTLEEMDAIWNLYRGRKAGH